MGPYIGHYIGPYILVEPYFGPYFLFAGCPIFQPPCSSLFSNSASPLLLWQPARVTASYQPVASFPQSANHITKATPKGNRSEGIGPIGPFGPYEPYGHLWVLRALLREILGLVILLYSSRMLRLGPCAHRPCTVYTCPHQCRCCNWLRMPHISFQSYQGPSEPRAYGP